MRAVIRESTGVQADTMPHNIMKGNVTELLRSAGKGDEGARDRLWPIIYGELHQIARRELRRRRGGGTLQTTAVVHEAFLKLASGERLAYQDRRHFFAVSALAMRQILVDSARRRMANKRRCAEGAETFDEERHLGGADPAMEVIALHEALRSLEAMNPRLAETVELRFFAGLSAQETAQLLEVSDRTVIRDWRKARAFLHCALRQPMS